MEYNELCEKLKEYKGRYFMCTTETEFNGSIESRAKYYHLSDEFYEWKIRNDSEYGYFICKGIVIYMDDNQMTCKRESIVIACDQKGDVENFTTQWVEITESRFNKEVENFLSCTTFK